MSEQDIKRGLSLVRYGGIVITVTVFIFMLAFSFVIGNTIDPSLGGVTVGQMMPYVIGFTVMAAILSIVLFFGYRAYLMGRKA